MWCIKRRVEPYVDKFQPNNVNSAVLSGSEFVEPSPLHEFMFQEIECDGKKSIRITSDIYMLFNQQRLDKLTRSQLVEYFDNLSVSEPKMSDLRKKMTDEQLCSFVKSRFIQTPSELMAWSQYLMSSQDAMIAAAAVEIQPVSEPTPPPEPAPVAE
ncbi:hypothetical protein [Bacteroides eggerthii]|uniref:Uncharacterized protein n=1 Tax=Bacteroides eggerthii TaxID=28111 RepID=A0A380YJY2_9BACE|nr:hypothetical protein [Bacteroides eggerthii]EEC52971.1 hypothetical protein BACEGG_02722 [Bacteroides eggerthii DSM 20697]QRQ47687.1 hypothetical protein I6J51_11525 [Bacteroides eggerthii]UWN86762.1 hypothetical protein NQ546_11245 [Bacteroides eggerthii]SUV29149.1 Uncharacterised protein [Bacteroides eggerthii]